MIQALPDTWQQLYEAYWRWADAVDAEAKRQAASMPDDWRPELEASVRATAYDVEREKWIAGYRRLMELERPVADTPESQERAVEARETALSPKVAESYRQDVLL